VILSPSPWRRCFCFACLSRGASAADPTAASFSDNFEITAAEDHDKTVNVYSLVEQDVISVYG
jgi:hypothetical protein